MAYVGAVAVIFGVFMIWREYSAHLDNELISCGSFLKALTDYRDKMRCYMETPGSWAEGYSDKIISDSGFIETLKQGDSFADAYRLSRGRLCISDDVDEILASCFSRLGDGYLDTELETLGLTIDKLMKKEAEMSAELSKKRKATGAMLGACALGIVILVI